MTGIIAPISAYVKSFSRHSAGFCIMEVASGSKFMTHKTKHPLFSVWRSMLNRCRNEKAANYAWYGAKGIHVCPAWDDFEVFVRDMGERPKGYFLNRIDKSGSYEPQNCCWTPRGALRGKQVTFMGATCSIAEWSRRTGISAGTIRARIRSGWNIEKAITFPTVDSKEFRYALKMVSGDGAEHFSKETSDLLWALQQVRKLRKQAQEQKRQCELSVVKRRYDEDSWSLVL